MGLATCSPELTAFGESPCEPANRRFSFRYTKSKSCLLHLNFYGITADQFPLIARAFAPNKFTCCRINLSHNSQNGNEVAVLA